MFEQTIHIWAPLVFAGIGGVLSYRAGVLNIALEGSILLGAFTLVAADLLQLGIIPALLLSALVPGIIGLLFGLWSMRSGGNIFIIGLGVNLLIGGGITTISSLFLGGKGVIQFSHLQKFSGKVHSLSFSITAAVLITLLIMFFLYKTKWGVRMRGAGSSPDLLKSRRISPGRYKTAALILSSSLAGMCGGILALRIGAFVPGMSANRGWIALVLVFIGKGTPAGAAAAAVVYSLAEAATVSIQGSSSIPGSLLLSLPYFITIFFLLLTNIADIIHTRHKYSSATKIS